MSLTVSSGAGHSNSGENFDETKQDLTEILPSYAVLEIFSYLNLATLGTICRVSKHWKQLVDTHDLWKITLYREIAFGNDKWAKCFGADVVKNEDTKEEFSSLPLHAFIEDCKKFKSIFPEKNAKDSLMLVRLPKTLNEQFTLKSLGELAKKYFKDSDAGYGLIWSSIVHELGDKPIDKSHWVLMTKDVLPGSRNKSYDEQQQIVTELAEQSPIRYGVPGVLESAACILSQYFGSNTRLFSHNPLTYTRCKEEVRGYQIVVGGFAPAGLSVNDGCDDGNVGVAALRKF